MVFWSCVPVIDLYLICFVCVFSRNYACFGNFHHKKEKTFFYRNDLRKITSPSFGDQNMCVSHLASVGSKVEGTLGVRLSISPGKKTSLSLFYPLGWCQRIHSGKLKKP